MRLTSININAISNHMARLLPKQLNLFMFMGNYSDFILLSDKRYCPACHHKSVSAGGHCNSCGIRLFQTPINFKRYESDGGIANYWLWTSDRGWIHRDHCILGSRPQTRAMDWTLPEPNTKTAEEKIAEMKQG